VDTVCEWIARLEKAQKFAGERNNRSRFDAQAQIIHTGRQQRRLGQQVAGSIRKQAKARK
jgi:hypothetical protein